MVEQNGKFVLTLSPSSLTNYQKCPTAYAFSKLMQIEPRIRKESFKRGTELGKILNVIHWLIRRYRPSTIDELRKKVYRKVLPFIHDRFLKTFSFQDTKQLTAALIVYLDSYDFLKFRPMAIEAGFSKIIHEDNENIFILEGRLDLVTTQNSEILVGDTKTQAYKYDIYEFNNQVFAYLWALGANKFFYNYITLTLKPEVRREVMYFSNEQIEAWRIETVKWYKRVKESLQTKEFPQSRNSCTDKFGLCEFARICEFPNDNMKQWIIKSEFKQRKQYKAW